MRLRMPPVSIASSRIFSPRSSAAIRSRTSWVTARSPRDARPTLDRRSTGHGLRASVDSGRRLRPETRPHPGLCRVSEGSCGATRRGAIKIQRHGCQNPGARMGLIAPSSRKRKPACRGLDSVRTALPMAIEPRPGLLKAEHGVRVIDFGSDGLRRWTSGRPSPVC